METRVKNHHIVIGGGTSGLFLCQKLMERDGVILLEQGRTIDRKESQTSVNNVLHPEKFYSGCLDPEYSMSFYTTCQTNLGGRVLRYPQGKGLGGTSNINAMILTGGHGSLFDEKWPKKWNCKKFETLFENVISLLKPRTNPSTNFSGVVDHTDNSTLDSMNQVEYERHNERLMDKNFARFSYFQNIREGERILVHEALSPKFHIREGWLQVHESVKVTLIIFDGFNRATGVVVQNTRSRKSAIISCLGDGEVILCSGAIASPYILYKSIEICNRERILSKGIKNNLISLPMIGKNLQDHVQITLPFIGNWGVLLKQNPNVYVSIFVLLFQINMFILMYPYILRLDFHQQDQIKIYRNNGVHGWIYLNENGDIYNDNCLKPPRCINISIM